MTEINFSETETQEEKAVQGRKWIFRNGAALLVMNGLYLLGLRYVLSGVTEKIFTAAALAGMVCAAVLLTRTKHCRKVLTADLIISALPAVIIMIIALVKSGFPGFSDRSSPSADSFAWILYGAWDIVKNVAVTALKAAVIFVYGAFHVFAYIDLFETDNVGIYINSK